MKTYTNNSGTYCLLLNHGKQIIPTQKIRYIEGEGNYSTLNIDGGGKLISSFTLRLFNDHLKSQTYFFSPRKGLLINLYYLKEIKVSGGLYYAKLRRGDLLQLSRRRGKALIEYINANNWNIPVN